MNKSVTAIILAAGNGSRMQSAQKKQFMELNGKPCLYYSLRAFENSSVEEILLVLSKEDISYCKKEIVEKYGFKKVKGYIEGGAERIWSVRNGLKEASGDVVMIHDGARPCITTSKIEECRCVSEKEDALILAVPVKDTIKKVDEEGYIQGTPQRNTLYAAQTPQVFNKELLRSAYEAMAKEESSAFSTDDAGLIERYTHRRVRVIEGSYYNLKLTTPEDLKIAENFLKNLVDNSAKGW